MKHTENMQSIIRIIHRTMLILILFALHHQPLFGASGDISVDVKAGFNLLGCHLTVGDNTLPEIFPSVPNGSTISLWDTSRQEFSKVIRFSSQNGWNDKTARILPGSGFYFDATEPFRWTVSGSFPLVKPNDPLWPGNNLLTVMNPRGSDFLSKTGIDPQNGDQFFIWNGSGYTAHAFITIPGVIEEWSPKKPDLEPGIGFSYQSAKQNYPKERILLIQRINDENQWELAFTTPKSFELQDSESPEGPWKTFNGEFTTRGLTKIYHPSFKNGMRYFRLFQP